MEAPNEHPRAPIIKWREDVAEGKTFDGYTDWVGPHVRDQITGVRYQSEIVENQADDGPRFDVFVHCFDQYKDGTEEHGGMHLGGFGLPSREAAETRLADLMKALKG